MGPGIPPPLFLFDRMQYFTKSGFPVVAIDARRGYFVVVVLPRQNVMFWNYEFGCMIAQWPQPKTYKFKLVMIGAGVNRWLCPITAMATAFASH